jgi:hypothetical protein
MTSIGEGIGNGGSSEVLRNNGGRAAIPMSSRRPQTFVLNNLEPSP